MVDAADHEKFEQTKSELHSLLEKPQLAGIPVSHMMFAFTHSTCLSLSQIKDFLM